MYKPIEVFLNEGGKNICKKLLRCLSSLRLEDQSNECDYNYFKTNCIKYINHFRDSKLINNDDIELNQVFKDIFKTEIIEYDISSINIKELLNRLKAYLKRAYFNKYDIEEFETKIETYLGTGDNLNNYELKKLLKNNEVWLESEGYSINILRGPVGTLIERRLENEPEKTVEPSEKNTISEYCRGDLANLLDHSEFKDYEDLQKVLEIYDSIKEIFEVNENCCIEYDSLRLNISVNPISKTLLNKIFNYLFKMGILVKSGKDNCKWNNKWII